MSFACCCRVLLHDSSGQTHLYDPLKNAVLDIPEAPTPLAHALWDQADSSVFVLLGTDGRLAVYRLRAVSMHGPSVALLGCQPYLPVATSAEAQPQSAGNAGDGVQRVPLVCYNGCITWYAAGGELTTTVLYTHTALQVPPCPSLLTTLQAAFLPTKGTMSSKLSRVSFSFGSPISLGFQHRAGAKSYPLFHNLAEAWG